MSDYAETVEAHTYKAGNRDRLMMEATFTIGAAGAVSASDVDDDGITLTYASATGDYDLTFPKCVDARVSILLESDTLIGVRIQKATLDAAAGTASLITLGESEGTIAATDPADGDKLHVMISAEIRN